MVTDIFVRAERYIEDRWEFMPGIRPFGYVLADYRMFGFLANVRNYAAVEPISQPRGLPPGVELPIYDDEYEDPPEEDIGEHDHSWLLLSELLAVDFEQIVEDRRSSRVVNGLRTGVLTVQPGKGVNMTLREFLGPQFFEEMDRLRQAGVERIVFGFGS